METTAGPVAMETAAPWLPGGRREPRRHALLVVIGEVGTEPERGAVRGALERGIRSWNINILSCDLNQQLRLFVTRHLAQFSSEVKANRASYNSTKKQQYEGAQDQRAGLLLLFEASLSDK
ncbi:hypothetical protein Q9233_009387 [Columba guinea]|nr:hypothetical protein Q9233_009387 [Columba guinea]